MNSSTPTLESCVQELSEVIESKESFETAITKLSLLLNKKIGLRPADVYRVVSNLREIESRITAKFVEAHAGQSVSVDEAQSNAEAFRAVCINNVLDGKAV